MTDIDDYVTGHEDDVEEFDYEGFRKTLLKWSSDVSEDLKKNPYDMNLLCVNAVLNTVWDIVSDNTIVHSIYDDIGDYVIED